jgi:hypothetical protein
MVYREFITSIDTLNVDNITFSKPKQSDKGFMRISIYITENGDKSPLYLMMNDRHCFGVQASTGMEKGENAPITGYQLPIPMWGTDGPTEEQIEFLDAFDRITARCVKHLIENRKAIKKYTLTEAGLEKFTPMWRKRNEEGDIDESKGPTLYAKLQTETDLNKEVIITTRFADSEGRDIEPLTLPANFHIEKCLLQIHSIFIGTTIKLQVRVVEVQIEHKRKRTVSLMLKPRPVETIEQEPYGEDEKDIPDLQNAIEELPVFTEPAEDEKAAEFEPQPEPEPEPVPEPEEDLKPVAFVKRRSTTARRKVL